MDDLTQIGGQPLQDSGFENETPESGFIECELKVTVAAVQRGSLLQRLGPRAQPQSGANH